MHRLACLLACLLSAPAFAQEPSPPADTGTEAEAEVAALYRLGLDLAGKSKYAEACGVFDRITKEHPDSEYAAKAEEQMALAAMVEGGAACGGAPPAAATDEPTGPMTEKERRREASRGKGDDDGKTELIISQAIVGPALFGIGIPGTAGATAPWVFLSGGLVGLGAGIGIPLAVTNGRKVTEGQAMVVFSGELVGTWNGFFIAAAVPAVWESPNAFQIVSAASTGGILLGGAGGIAAAIGLKPTGGEVSMFRSGFTWGAYFGAASILLTNGSLSTGSGATTDTFLRIGISSDVGAAIGAAWATQYPISRTHMNVVNLSGYAGALGFGLIYGIVSLAGGETHAPVWGAVLTGGAIAGLVTGHFITKDMDTKSMAWMGGGVPIAVYGRDIKLGMPMPTPRVAPDGSLGVNLEIAAGRW